MHVRHAQAAGGFAGPGSLAGVPPLVSDSDISDSGSASLSGVFVRDDGAALPASASVFFYLQDFAQPDDFVRGQEVLNPTTGEFSTNVMNIPSRYSRLFLSFVITDPAEALDDGTDVGAVFALTVWNCEMPMVIVLQWSDTSVDLDLSVTEPGGKQVVGDKTNSIIQGVSAESDACTRLNRKFSGLGWQRPRRWWWICHI